MIVEHKTDARWLLEEWGAWRRMQLCGPRRVRSWWGAGIMERFLPQSYVPVVDVIVDEARAWRTGETIKSMDNQELSLLLLHQYVIKGSMEARAMRCGMTLTTYKRKRRQAESKIKELLLKTYCVVARKSEIIAIVEQRSH